MMSGFGIHPPPPANSSCRRQHSGGSSDHIMEEQAQREGRPRGRKSKFKLGEKLTREDQVEGLHLAKGRNADHGFWMGRSSIQSRNTPVIWTRAVGGDCSGVFFFYEVNALHMEFEEYGRDLQLRLRLRLRWWRQR